MGGIFGGGGQDVNISSPIIASMRIQTSSQGRCVPLCYGKTRLAGNLIWQNDFTAIPHTSTQETGGKGGGGGGTMSQTTYTYTVAAIMGLCEGPVAAVPTVWADKSQGTPAALGLSVYSGSASQAAFPYVTTSHPGEALGYRQLAYVATGAYDLGGNASLPNHTFEVEALLPFSSTIRDANPKDVLVDFLTHASHGAGYPSARLAAMVDWSNYCIASGIFVSPAYTEQQAAAETVTALARIGNAAPVYSEGVLKVIPYGDQAVTGNGATYTPNLTPAYALTDDDFLDQGGADPVIVLRGDPADAYNQVQVKFYNRANQYNEDVATAVDQASVELYGLRPMEPVTAHEIGDAAVASQVAQIILQRAQGVRNTYRFKLGWKYALLEPMDLLTLTEGGDNGLNAVPVRITMIEEDEAGELDITAEDAPAGVATGAIYPVQANGGYAANYNIAPGGINDPAIFEPPVGLTGGRMEVWAAISGGPLWGGCEVWVSDDNATFSRVGQVSGPARHGVLSALLPSAADPDTGNTLAVDLTASRGQLLGATQAQADNLDTLCWVDGELIAYRDATLTAANKYSLGYLRRGQYGTPIGAHSVNAKFARMDGAMVRFPFDPNRIGKPVYLKFPSYNIYGEARQNLADVPAYTYTLAGSALLAALGNVQNLVNVFRAGLTLLSWDAVTDPVRTVDYEVRKGAIWASAQVLGRTPNTELQAVGGGTYWVSAHSGLAYSAAPTAIVITGATLTQNVIATYDEAALGWPGTLSGGAAIQSGNIILRGAGDILAAANILAEPDVLWYGGVAASGEYDLPAGHAVNIGRVAPCNVMIGYTARGQSIYDNVLTLPDVLSVTDFLGEMLGVKVNAQPQIALAQADGIYGAWQNFIPGTYNAQYFKARLLLTSSDPQVTAILSGLTFLVDVPDRIVDGTTQVAAGGMSVVYSPAFNGGVNGNPAPLPQITILSAQAGDDVILSAQTLSGFTVQVVNGGAGVTRNINYKSQGY